MLFDVFVAYKTRPGEMLLCSNIFYCFCENILSHTLDVILKIPTVKTWGLGLQAYSPKFKSDPTVKEFKIAVSLEQV